MNLARGWIAGGLVSCLAASLQPARAGDVGAAQIDVSISVSVTPSSFQPGERGTVTLTLENAGPDAAGVAQAGDPLANFVIGPGFRLPTTWDWGPFDILWSAVSGCVATYDVIGPGPPPDFFFALVFQFYFEVIPPGESRVCTFDIQFLPEPFETFESKWTYVVRGTQQDTNPANNEIFYTIVAGAPYVPPEPAPVLSLWTLTGLALGMFALACAHRRRYATER